VALLQQDSVLSFSQPGDWCSCRIITETLPSRHVLFALDDVVVDFLVRVVVVVLLYALLVVSAENFEAYPIVAGNRANCVDNVDRVGGEESNWKRPACRLDEVVELRELFVVVEDGGQLFKDELCELSLPVSSGHTKPMLIFFIRVKFLSSLLKNSFLRSELHSLYENSFPIFISTVSKIFLASG